MNNLDIPLPTNRKFGFFFALIFLASALYFQVNGSFVFAYIAAVFAFLMGVLGFFNSSYLSPLNKAWMYLGYAIGRIVSPLVMTAIFMSLFLPIGVLMRFAGRDELRLRYSDDATYWRERQDPPSKDSFDRQF